MKTICPKCKTVVSEAVPDDHRESPVLICPKCRQVILTGREFDDRQTASFEEEAKLASGAVGVDNHRYRKQLKRYFFLLMILLVCVIAYQINNKWRNESALNATRNTTARAALKRLAAAQEAYYVDHQVYSGNLDELSPYFKAKKHIQINILRSDGQSWAATAYHTKSPTGFTFDSGHGGFLSDGFDRPQPEAR